MSTSPTAAGGPRAVVVRDLRYRYPSGVLALDQLSMSVGRGEVVGVVGPSGCGKTTLLRVVAGLLRASSGSVQITDGQAGRHGLALSMLFQEDTLVPWIKVAGNAGLHFTLTRKISREEARNRVDELLDLVGLQEFRNTYPAQLSGGMRRRVALVAAVAPHPRVLLLDEPFSALDEPTRVSIHRDVLKLIKALAISCLLVTHDLAEAITLCDRVVVLSGRPGRVVRSIETGLGDDRDLQQIRSTPRFLELYGELWTLMHEQATRPDTVPAD